MQVKSVIKRAYVWEKEKKKSLLACLLNYYQNENMATSTKIHLPLYTVTYCDAHIIGASQYRQEEINLCTWLYRYQCAQELVSHDIRNNTFTYKYTFSVEIVPICKVRQICLQGN